MSNICVNHNMSVICYDRIAESDNFECVSFLNRLSKKILNKFRAKIFFLIHLYTKIILILKTFVLSSAIYISVMLL